MHVVGPQLGLTQPGMTVVCGDSHTSTHGAFGALAFGIGTSEVEHVLATQTLPLTPFKTMAVTLEGELPEGSTAKDVILAVIARIGTGGGQGYVLEYRGEAIRTLSMEARMTDLQHVDRGRRAGRHDRSRRDHVRLPRGPAARARRAPTGTPPSSTGSTLRTDDDAVFDAEVVLDAAALDPFVTWGTNPGQGAAAVGSVPDPATFADDRAPGRGRARAGVHGPDRRHAAARHRRGHRVPRLVHQRPDRGPARGGRRRPRAPQGGTACACSWSRLGAGPPAGRGGGAGQGLQPTSARSGATPAARCAWA